MASYCKVLMIGNLTRDPQVSYTPNQTAVAELGIATNRKWTAQDGTQREDVCFCDLKAFGKQAETLGKYMSKGKPIFIEGRLCQDNWTAQDGTKRSKHYVTIENFQFLGGNDQQGGQRPAPQSQAPQGGFQQSPPADIDVPF